MRLFALLALLSALAMAQNKAHAPKNALAGENAVATEGEGSFNDQEDARGSGQAKGKAKEHCYLVEVCSADKSADDCIGAHHCNAKAKLPEIKGGTSCDTKNGEYCKMGKCLPYDDNGKKAIRCYNRCCKKLS
ncbi:unnamed protein product [Cercospora beticola]|nr:unnamed protein product [Cercospora beticola]